MTFGDCICKKHSAKKPQEYYGSIHATQQLPIIKHTSHVTCFNCHVNNTIDIQRFVVKGERLLAHWCCHPCCTILLSTMNLDLSWTYKTSNPFKAEVSFYISTECRVSLQPTYEAFRVCGCRNTVPVQMPLVQHLERLRLG